MRDQPALHAVVFVLAFCGFALFGKFATQLRLPDNSRVAHFVAGVSVAERYVQGHQGLVFAQVEGFQTEVTGGEKGRRGLGYREGA